jgi:hypothetical protein
VLKSDRAEQYHKPHPHGPDVAVQPVKVLDLSMVNSCPKSDSCSAAYCPAVGGQHRKGEYLCHYLLESVKTGGHARVRGCLPMPLADAVINDGLRLLDSTGPLRRPLERASKRGSRIESMKRADAFKRSRRD